MVAEIHRGKIKKPLSKSVIDNIVIPNIEADLKHSYQTTLDLNKAHVVMIASQGIIKKDIARQILAVTREMSDMGDRPTFPIDPLLEGTYFNYEKYLIDRTGIEVGGQQHTARSRNDMIATELRMDIRTSLLKVLKKFIQLRKTLVEVAEVNKDAVMSGYTHLQPSEPITFAHYLSAVSAGLERDFDRLIAVYPKLNLCPMGGGSMGSTTWNIDRELMSELLGFDKPMDNSIDAVCSRDYGLEMMAALSVLAVTLSRLSQDLYVWATPEYGYIEVDDSVAICSSIMPQKKNPYTLEYVKGKCGHVAGFFIGAVAAIKNTPYTNVCDAGMEGLRNAITALEQINACFELLIDTIGTLKTNKETMYEHACGNFCTVTELANLLVRHEKISFRQAHEIVALIVAHMIEKHRRADEISRDVVNEFFGSVIGRNISLSQEEIQTALDPAKNAQSKVILGGTADEEVSRQLAHRLGRIKKDEACVGEISERLRESKERLENAVTEIISSI